MLKDLKKIKDKVQMLLQNFPVTRDCDKYLWLGYMVYFTDLKKVLGNEENYMRFKEIIMDKNTPSFESIRRVRQKLQESNPDVLGGKKRIYKLKEADLVKDWARKN